MRRSIQAAIHALTATVSDATSRMQPEPTSARPNAPSFVLCCSRLRCSANVLISCLLDVLARPLVEDRTGLPVIPELRVEDDDARPPAVLGRIDADHAALEYERLAVLPDLESANYVRSCGHTWFLLFRM